MAALFGCPKTSSVYFRYDALELRISSQKSRQRGLRLGEVQVLTFTFPDHGESTMSYYIRRPGRKQSKAKPIGKRSLQKPNGVIRPRVQKVGGEHRRALTVALIGLTTCSDLCWTFVIVSSVWWRAGHHES